MSFWSGRNLRATLGGAWVGGVGRDGSGMEPEGVSIDTRTIRAGQVYFALRGVKHDGHAFLSSAFEKGAAMAVIDDAGAAAPPGAAVLRVADAHRALIQLATAYRQTLGAVRVVAITGSNGKTTTKRLVHAVLGAELRGTAAPKSFNNFIGVPLTILSASPADQYLVCELGSNAPGEIAQLAAIAQPDVGVITSIGRAHLEGFGSIEGVAREKASLLSHLRTDDPGGGRGVAGTGVGGVAIVPADSPHLEGVRGSAAVRISFGFAESADLRITSAEAGPDGVRFTLNGREEYRVGLLGRHSAALAAAAVAVGRRFGLSEPGIRAALAGAEPEAMRLAVRTIGGVRVINDAYNANPDSVLAALDTLASLPGDRRVVVLGDMLELGAASDDAHAEVLARALSLDGVSRVILVGPRMMRGVHQALSEEPGVTRGARIACFADLAEGRDGAVADLLSPGQTVLLKGSRLMGLERVVAALERRHRTDSPPELVAGNTGSAAS